MDLERFRMRVLHICYSLDGGAGLCAERIMKATSLFGIENKAIVVSGIKNHNTDVVKYDYPWSSVCFIRKAQAFLSLIGKWPKEIHESQQMSQRIKREKEIINYSVTFTSPITKYKNLVRHPWVQETDIIHLHWVGGFLDYESFFKDVNKPIVWTLHDENPGLGGFHYSSWKKKSPNSFQLLDDELIRIKDKAYKSLKSSMTLVAISTKMEEFIQQNSLLHTFPSVLINNGIDGDSFVKIRKNTAREALSISEERIIFLFAAFDIHDNRKGLKELIEALEFINNPKITLICLGHYKEIPNTSIDIRCEGFISNNRILSIFYSAADYFLMPSFQEAFAQTPMEAMACGTPVISFPCSGAVDLINDKNGIICKDFTVKALIEATTNAMNISFYPEIIREDLLSRFSYPIIAKKYVDLYNSVLS